MQKKVISVGLLSILLLAACGSNPAIKPSLKATQQKANNENRLIVLSDIEADPDDSQSLIRLFLYSNQLDIEGLVATSPLTILSKDISTIIFDFSSILVARYNLIPLLLVRSKEQA